MDWIYFVLVLLIGSTLAQQGYDYSRPSKPFAPSTGRPGEAHYPGPSGPTTQFPGTTGGYPSGKPQGTGYPGSQGSYPGSGSQGPSYPGPQGPSYPGSQRPQGPTGQYPGSQGTSGSQRPGGAFPSGPSYPGAQGPSYSGTHGPSGPGGTSEDGHYEESFDEGDYSAIPGQPETDYPIYSYIPETSFRCDQQQYPGYYADVETRCQVFHICANDKTYDFLCPNGTIFHQEYLVCVWWNQFDCNSAPSLYGINGNIYDQSISAQGSHGEQGPRGPGGPQGPSQGYPGSGPQGSAPGYPGNGPQKPAPGYPGPQGPAPGYPGSRPAPSYPGTGPQKPGYPGSGQQGSNTGYPGPGPQRPDAGYPGPGSREPGGYPSSQGPAPNQSGTGYPGSGKPSTQQPTREYLPPVDG